MTENININNNNNNNNTDTNSNNSQAGYNPNSIDAVKAYTDNSTFNYENLIIKGNIATDIVSKVKNKERIEFSIAVNKWNSQRNMPITKWFNIIIFEDHIIETIKNNPDYQKGANVEIHGEIMANHHKGKDGKDRIYLKCIAKQIALNIPVVNSTASSQ